ncbi:Putative b-type cytochrome hydrogenase, OhcB-like [Desulfonema limicola]|uniref:B-type cytochrome hydrogenase, OhcB-like n=1 Tax=Desulfonema limicola TaxID=45656 RepID=A0A975GH53_9BACT|nr:cytochrome b/b6 domain-containing protein [Desulfonema limicola]QTA80937.1 Putative b-type cytochrome hydrogenase, OhcB-like [Desulfonema limicola]
MTEKKKINIYIYSRYERFWHWFQAATIFTLLITGFEVNGAISLFGFKKAVSIHNFTGITWLTAFAFFVFWVFTTGEWKQYIPTTKKMFEVIKYYAYGIFRGQSHPVPKRKEAKHNPLQRLTYLSLAAILLPVQMLTGFLYWGYNSWEEWGISWLGLGFVAVLHTMCAFAILSFIIVHLYMTTTGHTLTSHTKAMITGWEEVEEDEMIEDWEKKAA